MDLLPGVAGTGFGQGLRLSVIRIVLSEVPTDLSLVSSAGMRQALTVTLLVRLGLIALTTLLSLRLPRTVR